MMVDRRTKCNTRHPICMTAGFMFGMIIGSILHTNGSTLGVGISVILATTVFHLVYAKNFNILQLVKQVIKKGS